MKKYLLTAVINGHELPSRKFSTLQKAESYRQKLADHYDLQLDWEDRGIVGYEKYRTWIAISPVA